MRIVTERQLAIVLGALAGTPKGRDPNVRMLRTETVNDPAQIARQPRMTSVNGALQVDLLAQANATWVNGRVHSGFGGQRDFAVGALHSPGGQAIIALPSWHLKADVSSVVPRIDGPVTSFQDSFIVSEQGAAVIWAMTRPGPRPLRPASLPWVTPYNAVPVCCRFEAGARHPLA